MIFELILHVFWKVLRRRSMLGLNKFKVFVLTFLGRWCEISLCCFHPFGYDLVWCCMLLVMIFHMLIDAWTSHLKRLPSCVETWREFRFGLL